MEIKLRVAYTGEFLVLRRRGKLRIRRIVVLGHNADPAVTGGAGSSYVTPFHAVSVLEGIRRLLGPKAEIVRVPWCHAPPPNQAGWLEALNANGAEGAPPLQEEDVDRVRLADAAIVCVGYTHRGNDEASHNQPDSEGEAADRSYALPPGQAELIRAVARLNPRTVVILNAGGSVATAGWIDQVPAFLDAYYPGQEGGTAVAEILFGRTTPSGKLAFSWEKKWEDCAAYGHYPTYDPPLRRNAALEGVFTGYRWFDRQGIEPLFPFGFGLSYTTFAYRDLKIAAGSGTTFTATVTIRNTGSRPGAEIAQLYVEPPPAAVPRPARELKGFARVDLAPGESRQAQIHFARADLGYWDPDRRQWTWTAGAYQVRVGGSSRDLPVRASLEL